MDLIEKHKLINCLEVVVFEDKQMIITAESNVDGLFIIKDGCIAVKTKEGKDVRQLFKFDYFGINSLIFRQKATMSCISVGKSECYKITCQSFEQTLGNDYRMYLIFAIFKIAVSKNSFFSELVDTSQHVQLFNCFTLKNYSKGEVIFHNEKQLAKKIIIVLEGDLVNKKGIRVADRGTIFGHNLIDQYEQYLNK